MKVEFAADDSTGRTVSEQEQKSILSCIRTIAATPHGAAPYMRDMGMQKLFPDNNSPMAENEYISDLMGQLEEYEGRITPSRIYFENDNELKVVVAYGGD